MDFVFACHPHLVTYPDCCMGAWGRSGDARTIWGGGHGYKPVQFRTKATTTDIPNIYFLCGLSHYFACNKILYWYIYMPTVCHFVHNISLYLYFTITYPSASSDSTGDIVNENYLAFGNKHISMISWYHGINFALNCSLFLFIHSIATLQFARNVCSVHCVTWNITHMDDGFVISYIS